LLHECLDRKVMIEMSSYGKSGNANREVCHVIEGRSREGKSQSYH